VVLTVLASSTIAAVRTRRHGTGRAVAWLDDRLFQGGPQERASGLLDAVGFCRLVLPPTKGLSVPPIPRAGASLNIARVGHPVIIAAIANARVAYCAGSLFRHRPEYVLR
jgi:hypothetical protein